LWHSIAAGLHPPGLKSKTCEGKQIKKQHQPSGICDVTVKPPGEKLNPRWKVLCRAWTITTRFIPTIESFTIFKETSSKPFIIFRAIVRATLQS
jgi:hypothetical protein